MKIQICYKVRDEDEKFINLTAKEYFDSLDKEENFEDDGIPKFNHAEEYLNIPTKILEWTAIRISEAKVAHSIRTQFFDNGKSWMTYRKDLDGYEEIILSSRLNDSDDNVVRIRKNSDVSWQVNTNVVITTLADGSQTEKRIF